MQKISSVDLMPDPFGWIEIPGKAYSISKYPITNAQYRKFVDAGGYETQKWWTERGWIYREREPFSEPLYWQDKEWIGDLHPVVGVSWFESIAFCLWLTDMTGENISLPTEEQWQFAAQGNDARIYPWGHDWNRFNCRNSVDNVNRTNKTSPVTMYEGKGNSPFDVVDMAGNVWEWCLTDSQRKTNNIDSSASSYILRGGSWDDVLEADFRCDIGHRDFHFYRSDGYGFRIVHLH